MSQDEPPRRRPARRLLNRPAGPGRWHAHCPSCERWVPVDKLGQAPVPDHDACQATAVRPEKYGWFDPAIHGPQPSRDQMRWRPAFDGDPGMSYAEALRIAGVNLPEKFVEWARSPASYNQAIRAARRETLASLRSTLRRLALLPDNLHNESSWNRVRAYAASLRRAQEVLSKERRDNRRVKPTRVTHVVQGGSPSLGKR